MFRQGADLFVGHLAVVIACWRQAPAGGLADFLARRSRRIDHLLNGRAVIVMEQGELHLERLRRERLTLEDFHSAARKEGIARLDEIDVAVLETDGAFSFIRRSP